MSAHVHKEPVSPDREATRAEHATATVIGRSNWFRLSSQILSWPCSLVVTVTVPLAFDGLNCFA